MTSQRCPTYLDKNNLGGDHGEVEQLSDEVDVTQHLLLELGSLEEELLHQSLSLNRREAFCKGTRG